MRISVQVRGAEAAAEEVLKLRPLLGDQPQLMATIARKIEGFLRRNLDTVGPPLSPVTKRIRRWYGYAEGPPLRRSGRLASSLVSRHTGTSATVEPTASFAANVETAGETSGFLPGRPVPARVWSALTDAQDADIGRLIAEHWR